MAAYNLSREFKNNGHEVVVVTGREHYFKRNSKFPLKETIDDIEVYRCDFAYPYINAGVRAAAHFILSFPITVLRLMYIMKKFKPDVVNIQFPWTQSFYYLLIKPFVKCRLVVTTQGVRDVHDLPSADKPKIWQMMRKRLLKKADAVTSNSKNLLDKTLDIYPRKNQFSCVVPNGISLADFCNKKREGAKRPYIFAIGRLHYDKGYDILIRAFSEIASRWPQLDLVIAGDGQEKESLETLVKELNLTERVMLVGVVLGEDKSRLFHNSEFFVLPSRIEPFGITVTEAMANSKAIVASRVGGVPEFIIDGENGYLVPSENSEALAGAIERILLNQDKRKNMEKINRKLVEKRFTWTIIARQYEDIFMGVANV